MGDPWGTLGEHGEEFGVETLVGREVSGKPKEALATEEASATSHPDVEMPKKIINNTVDQAESG